VKMWNEDRGFGFLTPAGGGEDVFVHRSSLGAGVTLEPGSAVTYEAVWDDRKQKDRASNVALASGGGGADKDDFPAPSSGGGGRAEPVSAPQPIVRTPARSHNIVGTFGDWSIHKTPMAPDSSGIGPLRHRITVRSDAPKGDGDTKRESFQIVGDGSWDKRLYPAGGDREETVVLKPGGATSRAADQRGKGHGRNWAVEGRPGTAFDILFDADAQTVSCELAER